MNHDVLFSSPPWKIVPVPEMGAFLVVGFVGNKSCATAFCLGHSALTRGRDKGSSDTSLSSWGDDDGSTNSIGDYVLGVHGGKYQFEEAGGATFAGRQFAESLYSSSDPGETVVVPGPLPSWAGRMGSAAKLGALTPLERFPVLSLLPGKPETITITNDERSWEHFYSKIVQVSGDGTVMDETAIWCHDHDTPLEVSPACGHLAPRGGSSNLCDPSKAYSDSATIRLQVKGALEDGTFNLFVVGTEAETGFSSMPDWDTIVFAGSFPSIINASSRRNCICGLYHF